MGGKYEIKPLVTIWLGIPVIRHGIFNSAAGLCGKWVLNSSTNNVWVAPRWILRRWIKLQERTEGEKP